MKIFQILNDICHWQTPYKTLKEVENRYAPNILFVETPDYVFEGWGYDATKEGDLQFIKPTPPEGWLYDDITGTFYLDGEDPPVLPVPEPTTEDDLLSMAIDHEYRLVLLELGVI